MMFSDEIVNIAIKHEDHTFGFLNYNPWFITEKIDNSRFFKGIDIRQYFLQLQKERPKLLIVPLVDNEFNRSKSNIAWIEATLCGAVCIAPDFPEWRKPGVITYKDDKEFYSAFDWAINAYLDDMNENSFKYIKENLMLTDINKLRKTHIEKILSFI